VSPHDPIGRSPITYDMHTHTHTLGQTRIRIRMFVLVHDRDDLTIVTLIHIHIHTPERRRAVRRARRGLTADWLAGGSMMKLPRCLSGNVRRCRQMRLPPCDAAAIRSTRRKMHNNHLLFLIGTMKYHTHTHTLSQSLTQSLSHSLSQSVSHSLIHSLTEGTVSNLYVQHANSTDISTMQGELGREARQACRHTQPMQT
jgi:hypothetical protein